MPDKKQLKLEDLLGNDGEPPVQSDDPAQQQLAAAVQKMITSAGNENWESADKSALWQEIAAALVPRPFVYRYLFLKIAASILFLLVAGAWLFWPRPPHSLVQFARQQHLDTSGDTRLILGQQPAVVIKGKNSSLVYGGHNITINADSTTVSSAPYNTLQVPYGRRARLQLDDGTVVLLNAGSKLVYPATFADNKREVYLEGEAFFEIAPKAEAPFFVYASRMETEVLGTSFNISAYTDDTRQSLVLASGSVRMRLPSQHLFGKRFRQLQPHEMAIVSNEELTVNKVDITPYTAWKDGRLLFYSTPLKEILKKLTRYYNIQLDLASTQPGLETCSGDFDLDDDLNNVLDVICATNSLRYERQGTHIVLKEKD
ncbi:FecR family protein [Chitinophaga arvensicola]|uniref:FecR protein n=1 Tax=Chitinophaga arvensicola TaxID=29529 RepID=A0A1I0S8S0_9BACT|nr:FecR family protein [Chitinophaga arvensicola]SEW52521.1 FecR protein [Chitinophaga arvensicola]